MSQLNFDVVFITITYCFANCVGGWIVSVVFVLKLKIFRVTFGFGVPGCKEHQISIHFITFQKSHMIGK